MVADVSIRLSVKDGEIVRTALKNIGRDGEAAWGRIEASAVRASAATQRAGKVANDNVPHYRRFGGAAQQAGYQIGDFAVQVASGQNALVALTQQASQMLGFFGPWGAVVGAAAAVAGALAVSMWDTDESAKAAEKSLKDYEDAVKSAESFIKRLNDETKSSSELLREQRKELLLSARERVRLAAQELETVRRMVESQRSQRDLNQRLNIDGSSFLGTDLVRVDEDALQAAVNNLAAQQQELAKLESRLDDAIEKNEKFKESQADDKAAKKSIESVERQAESVSKLIASYDGQREALFLTGRDLAVHNALLRVSGDLTEEQVAQITAAAGALYDYQVRLNDLNDALEREDKLMKEGERIKLANRTAQEEYNDEIARLNDLLEAGAINQETYGRAAKKAQEDLEKAQEKTSQTGQEFGRVLTGSLEDVLVGAESLEEAFGSLDGQIARIILRMTILKDLEQTIGDVWDSIDFGGGGSSGGSSGGIFGAIGDGISSLFGFANGGVMTSAGPVPLRAYSNGGVASSPQLALFGEGRTPEAYVPLPDGRNIPVKLEGGGEAFTYSPVISIDARNSTLSASEIRSIVKTAVDGSVAEVRNLQRRKGNARI